VFLADHIVTAAARKQTLKSLTRPPFRQVIYALLVITWLLNIHFVEFDFEANATSKLNSTSTPVWTGVREKIEATPPNLMLRTEQLTHAASPTQWFKFKFSVLVHGCFCDAVCGSGRGDDGTLRCHVTTSPGLTEQHGVDDLHPGDVSPSSTKTRLGCSDCRLCRHSCIDRATLQQHLIQVMTANR